MTFENGWTVSIQFGTENYCHRQHAAYQESARSQSWASETAEIAAWNSAGAWLPFDYDTVKGWVKTDEVAAFIAQVAAYPSDFHPGKPKSWDLE